MAVFDQKPCRRRNILVYFFVKKFKINLRALFKIIPAFFVVGIYWYWVNQRIISDTTQTFSLFGFFVLMSTATAYFPLPANLIVLGAVKNHDPLLISLVAGFATLIAYLSEYLIFTLLFKFNRVADFKNTWLYQRAAPLLDKNRFFILSFASFLPIPSEPLRIYAVTQRYSKVLFMLAGFLGRIPRYYLLGYYGKDYVNSIWFILAVFLFPGFLLLAIRGGVSLVNILRNKFSPEVDKSTIIPVTVGHRNIQEPDLDNSNP